MKKNNERNKQLKRILSLVKDLYAAGGYDVSSLAQKYHISHRTIQRDMAVLKEIGFNISTPKEKKAGKRVFYQVISNTQTKQFTDNLDRLHYASLAIALQRFENIKDSVVFEKIEEVADKISDVIGKKNREILRSIDRAFFSYNKFGYLHSLPEMFFDMLGAVIEQKICNIEYQSIVKKNISHLVVLPLQIFSYNEGFYVFCYIPKHENIITLHLHRIINCEITLQKGVRPANFNADQYEQSVFGVFDGNDTKKFRFRFSSHVADFIKERCWHPTQKIVELKNGEIELSFTCAYSVEIESWAVSWMDDVEVIQPKNLRNRLAEIGKYYSDVYE